MLPSREFAGDTITYDRVEEAVQEYIDGQNVVAFRINANMSEEGRPAVHQSVQHHFITTLRQDMQKAYRELRAGEEIDLGRIPMSTTGMDNSFNTMRNHRVQHELHNLSTLLYGEDYVVHIDRAWLRQGSTGKLPSFKKMGFHREGHPGVIGETAPSTAIIIVTSGVRYVTTIDGPVKEEAIDNDWRRVSEDEFNAEDHTIDTHIFEVRPGDQPICILINQNRPHGIDPRGSSTGIYFGGLLRTKDEQIGAKWEEWQRRGTWASIHVPMVREGYSWHEVKVLCTLMGSPFPIYGSGKHCEMDGIPSNCRSYANQRARCFQPMIPRWRSDGRVDQYKPEYREKVEAKGIEIHEDFWEMEESWVNCPLRMLEEFGAEYMRRIGFVIN